jgi:hypothetical protein
LLFQQGLQNGRQGFFHFRLSCHTRFFQNTQQVRGGIWLAFEGVLLVDEADNLLSL